MSDLQCPATLLIARPGEASFARHAMDAVPSAEGGAPSDGGGLLTDKGREQVHQLVGRVRPRRIAAVYSSQIRRAVDSAELAASELGLRAVVVDGLQELSTRDLAEDPHLVAKRFAKAIGEIADTHRGETVLVFTHGGAMSLAIPTVAVNVGSDLATQGLPPHCAVAEVEVDADGWRLVCWPGGTQNGPDSEQA
jgi:probable phosphoglycerate mutase